MRCFSFISSDRSERRKARVTLTAKAALRIALLSGVVIAGSTSSATTVQTDAKCDGQWHQVKAVDPFHGTAISIRWQL